MRNIVAERESKREREVNNIKQYKLNNSTRPNLICKPDLESLTEPLYHSDKIVLSQVQHSVIY